MNCEQAEDRLSAYLDDMLEPPARTELAAHLDECAACRAELGEFRRLDGLLAAAPRIAPADELHDRIFQSPEFARLLRDLERAADDRHSPDGVPATATATPRRVRIAPSGWPAGAWRAAAVLALVLGSALLIKQGLLHSETPSGHDSTLTIGAPTRPAPLSAGVRAVYEHDGRLWSAPASGTGIAQPLTPAGTTVAGWSVSPDGQLVAYIDAKTGHLHIIRSDDQHDRPLSEIAGPADASFWSGSVGSAVSAGIVWSPDGSRIAYLAAGTSGTTALHLMNADGSNDRTLNASAGAMTGVPVWSADSLRMAYTQTTGGVQSLWSYSTDTESVVALAAQADPAAASAMVERLAWLPDTLQPTVTWSTRDAGTITGLFSQSILSSGPAQRLTPAVMRFGAADFSAAGGGGVWVVAGTSSSPAIATVSARTGAMDVQSTGTAVSGLAWSPDGSAVGIVTHDGQLEIWTPGTPGSNPTAALSGVSGMPVWSPDGSQLAVQANGRIVSLHIVAGNSVNLALLGQAAAPVTLVWTPDGRTLAIAGPAGVTLVTAGGSAGGTSAKLVDAHPADGGVLVWSLAR